MIFAERLVLVRADKEMELYAVCGECNGGYRTLVGNISFQQGEQASLCVDNSDICYPSSFEQNEHAELPWIAEPMGRFCIGVSFIIDHHGS